MRITILDGYVDEPTCLGVPPYISTYVRYVAGALVLSGIPEEQIGYVTIDEYRRNGSKREALLESDVVILICGLTVPGRYLGGTPITAAEISEIASLEMYKAIGGPIKFGFAMRGGTLARDIGLEGFDLFSRGDIEVAAYLIGRAVKEGKEPPKGNFDGLRRARDVDRIAPLGAFIVRQHPNFPNVICEIETFRGCERRSRCSYCTEVFYGRPDFRSIEGIVSEVSSLYREGVRYFRIGRQPNILGYMSKPSEGEFPEPNVEAIGKLFRMVRNVGDLRTLHIDNVNAGTIAAFPEASEMALSQIAMYDTEGDVAALGLESADPAVIEANSLKVDAEGIRKAIRIVNRVGAFREREDGLYKLLPGINFLFGLPGESRETFRINADFLKSVVDEGLLLRRINIRQVMVFPGTKLWSESRKVLVKNRREFEKFKRFVKEEIDLPMMRRVFPTGTVIRNVLLEAHDGENTLGRQLATYPILVRFPERMETGRLVDAVVVGHRERSVIGIPVPIRVNSVSQKVLSHIPGVSKRLSGDIILKRPFRDKVELLSLFPQLKGFAKFIEI